MTWTAVVNCYQMTDAGCICIFVIFLDSDIYVPSFKTRWRLLSKWLSASSMILLMFE